MPNISEDPYVKDGFDFIKAVYEINPEVAQKAYNKVEDEAARRVLFSKIYAALNKPRYFDNMPKQPSKSKASGIPEGIAEIFRTRFEELKPKDKDETIGYLKHGPKTYKADYKVIRVMKTLVTMTISRDEDSTKAASSFLIELTRLLTTNEYTTCNQAKELVESMKSPDYFDKAFKEVILEVLANV